MPKRFVKLVSSSNRLSRPSIPRIDSGRRSPFSSRLRYLISVILGTNSQGAHILPPPDITVV
jgi:hypothetical protein